MDQGFVKISINDFVKARKRFAKDTMYIKIQKNGPTSDND